MPRSTQSPTKMQGVKDRVIGMEHNFEKKVQSHPVRSTALAFGSGFFAGALTLALMNRHAK